ncbi:MAG: quaternary ammonium transporter [Chloroflexi bacterium]|nr:quaternary ammonium transporter [Chloroflexota bacterium]
MKALFNRKRGTAAMAFLLLVSMLAGCIAPPSGGAAAGGAAAGANKGTITVASKDFTEQFILGEMYALLLENGGYTVVRKINLGGTPVAQQALLNSEIDVYPEYTGTGLLTVLKLPVMSDPKAVYDKVKSEYESQFKLTWLDPAPMNNTQALAMTKARATELGITTFSDMVAKASELTLVGPPEFAEREDGLPGLKKVYGDFELKSYLPIDPGLRYQALTSGQADVVVAFGTDGEIAANDLVLLKDDKGLYPPYQVAPVIRQAVLTDHADVAAILNKVAPLLTDETMQKLNNEVSGNKREPADVAKEFLTAQKLIK